LNVNDFYDWKKHPVTLVVFNEIDSRVKLLIEQLIEQTSTLSQSENAEKAGAIKALRDLLNISVDEMETTE
jgi:hypothetical protein